MRQLARTLLILGGVTACERAHPVDDGVRPATPLVDPGGAPAVGNIGQTGAPQAAPRSPPASPARASSALAAPPSWPLASSPSRRAERVHRAQRAARTLTAHAPGAIAPAAGVAPGAIAPLAVAPDAVLPSRPVLPPRVPPAAGTPSPLAPTGPTLSIQTGRSDVAASPLLDRRRRPAVANMGRQARMSTPRERLDEQAAYIVSIDQTLAGVIDEDTRRSILAERARAVAAYQQLAHEVAQAEQGQEADRR